MRKCLLITCLILSSFFSSAYDFPDKLPDWKAINEYSPGKLDFQNTTLESFKSIASGVEPVQIGNEIFIFTLNPLDVNVFNEVNVGFRDKKLDWIEFVLSNQIEIREFIKIYGPPNYVDTKYSDTLDYYNFDNFSVATDKKHAYARSISIFAVNLPSLDKNLRSKISDTASNEAENLFFDIFPKLKPGFTTEREFAQNYPDLLPYMEGDFDLNSIYTLVEELKGAGNLYQKAELRFENGILAWINLVPIDQDLESFLKQINSKYSIEKIDETNDFYIFDNFVLTVDRQQKSISNIGLVNFDKRF